MGIQGREVLEVIDGLLPGSLRLWVIGLTSLLAYYINSLFVVRQTTVVPKGKGFLLVIAHPDDECMFFSPAITGLLAGGNTVGVLCLSTGDYDGLGAIRPKELLGSCQTLGCKPSEVACMDNPHLKDDFKKPWQANHVADQIRDYLIQRTQENRPNIDAFITFDQHGVSQHPNHCSLLDGVRQYASGQRSRSSGGKGKLNAKVEVGSGKVMPVWKLLTISRWRKFIGIFDAAVTVILVTIRVASLRNSQLPKGIDKRDKFMCFMADPIQAITGQRAMTKHATQMVWFRWFWIIIGRYMYINELEQVF
ncbi:N-acetylglucosaminyl-phosphatidylinositol de-N-acetylase [Savitreella phatthalungensis]